MALPVSVPVLPAAVWNKGADARGTGIKTRIGNHTFRATGITAYLKNNGTLEAAQHIANHGSPRTTKLYDRRQDEISSSASRSKNGLTRFCRSTVSRKETLRGLCLYAEV